MGSSFRGWSRLRILGRNFDSEGLVVGVQREYRVDGSSRVVSLTLAEALGEVSARFTEWDRVVELVERALREARVEQERPRVEIRQI